MCTSFVEKYNELSDKELIVLSRDNDQDAFEVLFYRYLPLLKKIITKNNLLGSDFDDMLQDATISFYYAVQLYDFESSAFATFLSVCVDRSLKSTIRKATAQKRIPEGLIVPIDDGIDFGVNTKSAEEEYFGNNALGETTDELKSRLSELEFKVLVTYLSNGSYDVTAHELGLTRKAVDNALVRIRQKLTQ